MNARGVFWQVTEAFSCCRKISLPPDGFFFWSRWRWLGAGRSNFEENLWPAARGTVIIISEKLVEIHTTSSATRLLVRCGYCTSNTADTRVTDASADRLIAVL